MAEASYPYAGGGGITDAAYEQLMAEVTGNGRIGMKHAGQSLTVPIMYADSTGRQVKFRAGSSYLVRGFRWDADTGIVRSLDANATGNPRLDLAVLRLDRSTYTVRIEILKGVAAATPTLPAVTQNVTTTGIYEIPIGYARVNNGATNIASSDITSLETWHVPASQIGHSSTRPTTVEPGAIWTEYDTGKVYAGLQSAWHLIGENGGYTRLTGGSGWDLERDYVYAQRRNGMTTLQILAYRAAGTADLAANVDSRITTLPVEFRPAGNQNFYWTGSMSNNQHIRGFAEASTGYVSVLEHAVLKAGNFVHVGPISYPSR